MTTFIIIVAALILLYVIIVFNKLIGLRNKVKEAVGAIDIYLQNRHDALVKVAQAVVEYAKYEEGTLVEITKLREQARNRPPEEAIQTYDRMSEQLHSINLLAENYPDLKAGQNFLHLQEVAYDLEEKLSAARRTFNANVTAFNTVIASFPSNLFAGLLGFREKALLDIPESKKADINLQQMLSR